MQLSIEQQQALDAFEQNQNVFLTGPGGSGKTELIRRMVESCQKSGKIVQVCAMTGCAAVLLRCPNTKTLHSWAGIGLGSGDPNKIIEKVLKNRYKKIEWNKPDVLIVDEVSMLSSKLFTLLDLLGRKCRNAMQLPFGGLQLVFSGDFYQLPPIGTEYDKEASAFCFESKMWEFAFDSIIQLKTIFRQTDKEYVKILNQIRVGKLSKTSYNLLCQRVISSINVSYPPEKVLINPTILLPRRRDADAINNTELKKLTGKPITFTASVVNNLPIKKSDVPDMRQNPRTPDMIDHEISHLRSSIIADQKITLAVGAQVMCVANIDVGGPLPIVNGSQGIVVEFSEEYPVVKFRNGQKKLIGQHTWVSDAIPGLGVKQIPLILAWAITIHKAQGVTLDMAEIDAGSGIFECGQTYVALSRVRDLAGLHLTKFDPQKIKVNRKVQKFYSSLRTPATSVYPPAISTFPQAGSTT